jgi:hypothetical protein
MNLKAHSFQYGFKVRLITEVVCICSPSTETIANGSGRRRISLLMSESAATTVVERDDSEHVRWRAMYGESDHDERGCGSEVRVIVVVE